MKHTFTPSAGDQFRAFLKMSEPGNLSCALHGTGDGTVRYVSISCPGHGVLYCPPTVAAMRALIHVAEEAIKQLQAMKQGE